MTKITSDKIKSIELSDFTRQSDLKGSNQGGFFKHNNTGKDYYIKWLPEDILDEEKKEFFNEEDLARGKYKNRHRNRFNNEFLALKIYELYNVSVPKSEFITFTDEAGKTCYGITSEKEGHIKPIKDKPKAKEDFEILRQKTQEDFLIDVLLSNYDVVGMEEDNLHYDPETLTPFRLDPGAALRYFARGGPKKELFNTEVGEFEDMALGRNTKTQFNEAALEKAGMVFQGILKSPVLFISLKKLLSITDEQLIACIQENGFDTGKAGNKGIQKDEAITTQLLERKKTIIDKTIYALIAQLKEQPMLPEERRQHLEKMELPDEIIDQICNGIYQNTETLAYLPVSGPLPKSIYTTQLEELARELMKPSGADFTLRQISGEDYIILSNGHRYNWTEIREHANFEHIQFMQDDFKLYSDYFKSEKTFSTYNLIKPESEKKYRDQMLEFYKNDNDEEALLELSFQEMQAINIYTTGFYTPINALMRGTLNLNENKTVTRLALIGSVMCSSGLRKLPQIPIQDSYRWEEIHTEEALKLKIDASKDQLVVPMKGFISTSNAAKTAYSNSAIEYHYSHLKGLYVAPISAFAEEKELLIPPTQVQFTNYQEQNGKHYFECSCVSDLNCLSEKSLKSYSALGYIDSVFKFYLAMADLEETLILSINNQPIYQTIKDLSDTLKLTSMQYLEKHTINQQTFEESAFLAIEIAQNKLAVDDPFSEILKSLKVVIHGLSNGFAANDFSEDHLQINLATVHQKLIELLTHHHSEKLSIICETMHNQIVNLVQIAPDVTSILKSLSIENREVVYNSIKDHIVAIANTPEDFGWIVHGFLPERQVAVLNELMRLKPNVLENSSQLIEMLTPIANVIDRTHIFNEMHRFVKTPEDMIKILHFFPVEQHSHMFKALLKERPEILERTAGFSKDHLKNLSPEDYELYTKTLTHYTEFSHVRTILSRALAMNNTPEHQVEVLNEIFSYLNKGQYSLVSQALELEKNNHNISDLVNILNQLSPEYSQAVYQGLKQQIGNMIDSSKDPSESLVFLLNSLQPKQRSFFYEDIPAQLLKHIPSVLTENNITAQEFKFVLKQLKDTDVETACKQVGKELLTPKSIIDTCKELSSNNRLAVFKWLSTCEANQVINPALKPRQQSTIALNIMNSITTDPFERLNLYQIAGTIFQEKLALDDESILTAMKDFASAKVSLAPDFFEMMQIHLSKIDSGYVFLQILPLITAEQRKTFCKSIDQDNLKLYLETEFEDELSMCPPENQDEIRNIVSQLNETLDSKVDNDAVAKQKAIKNAINNMRKKDENPELSVTLLPK